MTYSVLKWIFNAIKKDNAVKRDDLLDQLSQNLDIVKMFGYESIDEVQVEIDDKFPEYNAQLNWDQFLDLFLSKFTSEADKTNPWWKTLMAEETNGNPSTNYETQQNI